MTVLNNLQQTTTREMTFFGNTTLSLNNAGSKTSYPKQAIIIQLSFADIQNEIDNNLNL